MIMDTKRKPTHPGVFFKHEFMQEDESIKTVAEKLHVSERMLKRFIEGKTKCLPKRIAKLTGTSAEFWINMQKNVDKWEDKNKGDRYE